VPIILILAPTWAWVVSANVLLGISQGLTWSVTVVMKIDLVGPARRGFAMGLNEAAGDGTVAATALATGYLAEAYGLRPAPFLLELGFAALGLGSSLRGVWLAASSRAWKAASAQSCCGLGSWRVRDHGHLQTVAPHRVQVSLLLDQLASSSMRQPKVTAASTTAGAVERRAASGGRPSASLTVENAKRNATNTVIAKICASLNPASRSACTSAALLAFGSRATLRAQPAMTRSLLFRPSSLPRRIPAADCASPAVASLLAHTSEQYESPNADVQAATRMMR